MGGPGPEGNGGPEGTLAGARALPEPEDETMRRASLAGILAAAVGDEGGEIAERIRRRLRLKDIEQAVRGVLLEVNEESGDRVLVWLR